jgi:chromosome segregation ATPase
MSDTPRTDAATLTEPHQVRELVFEVVKADYMAELERELNEANAQLRSLKLELKESYKLKDSLVKEHLELCETLKEANRSISEAKTHLQEVDLPDEPIDIQAKRLRDAHNWQAGIAAGYEKQIQSANETLRKLNDALDEANADRRRLREALETFTALDLSLTHEVGIHELEAAQSDAHEALTTPPPPVVAKPDADALAEAVEIMRVGICSAAMPNASEREIASDAVKQASEVLKTYRNKYKEGEDNEMP